MPGGGWSAKLRWLALAAALVWAVSAPAWAAATVHARLDRLDRRYEVHADLTWTEIVTTDTSVATERGVRDNERDSFTFYPQNQTLEVVEAWVDQPDGTRLPVADDARFTRPSEAAQDAPGFTSSMTTTVLFPQVHPGSRTHVVWRLTQTKPALLGFNAIVEPSPDTPVGEATVDIVAPADAPLHWAARGGFTVTDATESGQRHIHGRLADTQADEPERDSVDDDDYAPMFLATSLPDLAELGAIYYRQSQPKAAPTAEVAALAKRVANGQTGLAAARAVYDWVAANIRYVAVYLDPNDGWIPHAAAEVLHNGYGDCKDHVVLMQAMLTALDIPSEAALIDQGTRTQDLPLWVPQFNHVVVYLPGFDRFANPTNPYARFESLDRMLAGHTVVLATERGEVSRTPAERPADNTYGFDSHLTLAADGQIDGTADIVPSANLEAAARSAVAHAVSAQDLAERLLATAPEGGFGQFATSDPRDLTQPFHMTATWRSPHAIPFDGGEAYATLPEGLDLDPPANLRRLLTATGTRRHAMLVSARDYRWTVALTLPQGVSVRRLPHDVHFANGAGSYDATYRQDATALHSARRLVIGRAVFQAADYPDLQALIYAALDDSRAVFAFAR